MGRKLATKTCSRKSDAVAALPELRKEKPKKREITLQELYDIYTKTTDYISLSHSQQDKLEYAWKRLREAGYLPYYLYRQKYMSGALENIGWCKPGCEGIYNICIMEELHTILALGGGGSTKLTDPETGKIVRITNPKYPHVYLERVEQVCQNKAELVPFHLALRQRARGTS